MDPPPTPLIHGWSTTKMPGNSIGISMMEMHWETTIRKILSIVLSCWLLWNICFHYRFAYTRTDGEGYSSYSYQRIYNGQTLLYYLHFYDEGLFYNGFWVVNDLETGFVETEGRVFVYNSENDYCVEVQISKFNLLQFMMLLSPGRCRLLVHLGRRGLAIQHKHLYRDLLMMSCIIWGVINNQNKPSHNWTGPFLL